MPKDKYTDPFYRIATRAFVRNGDIEYTGDTLMLALLLHTTGKGRGGDDEKYVAKLLDDPNQDRR